MGKDSSLRFDYIPEGLIHQANHNFSKIRLDENECQLFISNNYGNSIELLKDLSRSLNRGYVLIRSGCAFPLETRVNLELNTTGIREPLTVNGNLSAYQFAQQIDSGFELQIRPNFDAHKHRKSFSQLYNLLYLETPVQWRNRATLRVPVELQIHNPSSHNWRATVTNISRGGCKMEIIGRDLPKLNSGDKIQMGIWPNSKDDSEEAAILDTEVVWHFNLASGDSQNNRILYLGCNFVNTGSKEQRIINSILDYEEHSPIIKISKLL